MSALPILENWPEGILAARIPANNNVRLLQTYLLTPALSVSTTAQPGSPAEMDVYIIPAAATGSQWATFDEGDVAIFYQATWTAYAPFEGLEKFVLDQGTDGEMWQYVAGVWAVEAGSSGAGDFFGPGSSVAGNIVTFADSSGKLGADSGLLATAMATKAYVDALIQGLSWKKAVRAATTVAGTLASSFENGDTIDGIVLVTNDRILIKNQASPVDNGIYTVNASGAPTRTTDADTGAEMVNATVYVSEGTSNADTQWTCTTNAPITLGVTSIAFSQISSGATAWGAITGTLSSQADLAAALALKQNRSPNIQSVASSATVTPTFSNDQVEITAQAAGLTLANPTGTAIPGLGISIRIKDNGTARTISYGTDYRAIGVTLPSTTVISKTLYLGMIYNSTDAKWDVVAVAQEA